MTGTQDRLALAEAAVNAAVKMLIDAPVYAGSVCIPSTEVLRWTLTHAKALNHASDGDPS